MRIKICSVDELKEGGHRTVRILARSIAVFRIQGQLYAVEADCKHMRASIASGKLEGTIITCPAHGWRYDITTGQCLNESWAKLKTYEITIENDHLFVNV